MNVIDTENDAALAEVYENDLTDKGAQSESVKIDDRDDVKGTLDFDPTNVELIMGGTNEDVTAAFFTLKRYWPDRNYPKPLESVMEIVVNGRVKRYQVRQLNGDKDNRATLAIGIGAFSNRGK